MIRVLALIFLVPAGLFAADSRALLVAIRAGDHAQIHKLLRAGATPMPRTAMGRRR